MTYHVEVLEEELWSLEPWITGYAVLICTPAIGIAWIHMTEEALVKIGVMK